MFALTIDTENSAFEENPAELADLIRKVADRIKKGETYGRVIDANGNVVGNFEIASDE